MGTIVIPSTGPSDWQRVLAKPDLHWRSGASAMTLAACWEAAQGDFPPELRLAFDSSTYSDLVGIKPLLIIPEFGIQIPGGSRSSMTDVFILAKGLKSLVAIAVEGKVNEPFGPIVGEKRKDASTGQLERLQFLQTKLGISRLPDDIRYQLLHRSVSAILAAEQFGADISLMIVHSFSPTMEWFDDFKRFAELLGTHVQPNHISLIPASSSPKLYIGWCCGELSFTKINLKEVKQ